MKNFSLINLLSFYLVLAIVPLRAVVVQADHMIHPDGSSVLLLGNVYTWHPKRSEHTAAIISGFQSLHEVDKLGHIFVEDEYGELWQDGRYKISMTNQFKTAIANHIKNGENDPLTGLRNACVVRGLPCTSVDVRKNYVASLKLCKLPRIVDPSAMQSLLAQARVPSVYEVICDLEKSAQSAVNNNVQYECVAINQKVKGLMLMSLQRLRLLIDQFPQYQQLYKQFSLRDLQINGARLRAKDPFYDHFVRAIDRAYKVCLQQLAVSRGYKQSAVRTRGMSLTTDLLGHFSYLERWAQQFGLSNQEATQAFAGSLDSNEAEDPVLQWVGNYANYLLFDVKLCDQLLASIRPEKTMVVGAGLFHTDFLKQMLLQKGFVVEYAAAGHCPGFHHPDSPFARHPANPAELLNLQTVFDAVCSWHMSLRSKLLNLQTVCGGVCLWRISPRSKL